MKRLSVRLLAALAAVALFGALVHGVLVAAGVSEPGARTVRGTTPARLWATAAAGLALVSVVIGGLAARPPIARFRIGPERRLATVAVVAGLIAMINAGMILAVANGGPGTGNGVVGAAAAFVLSLMAMALGSVVLVRYRSQR